MQQSITFMERNSKVSQSRLKYQSHVKIEETDLLDHVVEVAMDEAVTTTMEVDVAVLEEEVAVALVTIVTDLGTSPENALMEVEEVVALKEEAVDMEVVVAVVVCLVITVIEKATWLGTAENQIEEIVAVIVNNSFQSFLYCNDI